MKNFRDYENLIREQVAKIAAEDPNWNFTVRSLGKYQVRIRWTYLDYLGENENCFSLLLRDYNEALGEFFLSSRTPHGNMIGCHFVSEDLKGCWQESYVNGIKYAIEEIADFAHSRY